MFDLHYLTILGIIIIAAGSIVGTILLQCGNALKSQESSVKTQAKLDEQKLQLENVQDQLKIQTDKADALKMLSEQQSLTLNYQSEIISNQLKISKQGLGILEETQKSENSVNWNKYNDAIREFQLASYFLFNSSFPKSKFLSLDINSKKEIFKITNNAMDKILNNPIVVSDNNYFTYWSQIKNFHLSMFEFVMLNPNSWVGSQVEGTKVTSQEDHDSKIYELFQKETKNLYDNINSFPINWFARQNKSNKAFK
jgi:hypothetical protein